MPKSLNFVKITATFLGLGYLPFMSGSFASIAGLLIFVLIGNNTTWYLLITALILLLGFGVSGRAERIFNQKDSHFIVIDEVAGMLIALLFLPYNLVMGAWALILFRILDIAKPFPANGLQRLSGSRGIMADDIIAGLYANIILQVVLRLVSWSGS